MILNTENPSLVVLSIGSESRAEQIARRCEQHVPAYRKLIGNSPAVAFHARPVTTKESYVQKYPADELLGDDADQTIAIFASSGSSGSAHYWPHLREQSRYATLSVRYMLEKTFLVRKRKTMAIVAGALGSWIGGDYLSWILKSIALHATYPFSVFTPGKHPEEIVEALAVNTLRVDQFILFLCPSDIPHLYHLAETKAKVIPYDRLRFLAMGEPIPEPARMSLQERAGIDQDQPFMLSVYGSTDTGTLGAESEASVAIRKLLTVNNDLARSLGLNGPVPHLFHCSALDAYLEVIENELCVTRWQGIPIVRYNLRDSVTLYSWKEIRRAILESNSVSADQEIYREVVRKASSLYGDLIAVHGRSDRCIIIGGSNLSEPILDEAVRSRALEHVLTGKYRAQIVYRRDQQFLELKVEKKPGVSVDAAKEKFVYDTLIETLGRLQPEFRADWDTVYRHCDADPLRRVLQIEYLEWPALSHTDGRGAKVPSLKTR